jgi:hypothetical protein
MLTTLWLECNHGLFDVHVSRSGDVTFVSERPYPGARICTVE